MLHATCSHSHNGHSKQRDDGHSGDDGPDPGLDGAAPILAAAGPSATPCLDRHKRGQSSSSRPVGQPLLQHRHLVLPEGAAIIHDLLDAGRTEANESMRRGVRMTTVMMCVSGCSPQRVRMRSMRCCGVVAMAMMVAVRSYDVTIA